MWKKIVWGTLSLVGVAAIAVAAVIVYRSRQPIVPSAIRRQANFVIFYPTEESEFKLDPTTLKYDAKAQLITYLAKGAGNKVVFTQQATPESFSDIPQVYDKLLEKLRQYGSFESTHGKVTLTHPVELKGNQTAVMNAKGTLMFVRPEVGLEDNSWRRLFKTLEFAKP